MSNFGKMSSATSLPLVLLAIAVACPAAAAQDTSRTKTPATTPQKPSGAVSSSYARSVPANPDGGAETEETSPAQSEAAARDQRTYTGGRRNEDAPSAVEAAPGQPIKGVIVKGGQNPRPRGTAVPAPTPPAPARSISEKGVK